MKKMFLLLGFCCFISILQAQVFKIEHYRLPDQKKSGEKNYVSMRIENIDEALGVPYYRISLLAPRVPKFSENCEKWANQIVKKIITKEIKNVLRDSANLKGKSLALCLYFDKNGKVLTVTFIFSRSIYDRLLVDQFKVIYRKLMKEKIRASDFCKFESKATCIGSLEVDFAKLVLEERLKFD